MIDKTEAADQLREMLPPGSTARTILRHVSASGMTRWISVVIDGEDYSWLAARAMGAKLDPKYGGIKRVGCGMDMGFDLVYSLSRTLYPDGFACVEQAFNETSRLCEEDPDRAGFCAYHSEVHSSDRRCPGADHSNRVETDWHKSGGYAISQRWL
jgi:hypothetical protein